MGGSTCSTHWVGWKSVRARVNQPEGWRSEVSAYVHHFYGQGVLDMAGQAFLRHQAFGLASAS